MKSNAEAAGEPHGGLEPEPVDTLDLRKSKLERNCELISHERFVRVLESIARLRLCKISHQIIDKMMIYIRLQKCTRGPANNVETVF